MSVTNTYLETQIVNQINMVENFKHTCKLASLKDDGVTSKEEEKILAKLTKESDAYIKRLKKIIS